MDSCHFLLGRPWHYDIKAIHNGEKNSYAFQKNEVTYNNQSLMDEDRDKIVGPNVLLVSGKEFLTELKREDGVGFFIVVKPKEEEKLNQPPMPGDVQHLLDQFKDILSDGALATLPPQRAVSHQIDFIPGALLPKKALMDDS